MGPNESVFSIYFRKKVFKTCLAGKIQKLKTFGEKRALVRLLLGQMKLDILKGR